MRAETKAKRRVTLSICGLGMLDETEVDSIPGAAKITPTAGADERLTEGQKTMVTETVRKVAEWIATGSIADAVQEAENAGMDADEYVYFWTFFDSKQRSAMKKELARAKAQALDAEAEKVMTYKTPSISSAQHKRLEARIAELDLDREQVKDYCKQFYGKAHFTQLTAEEYEGLDTALNSMPIKVAGVAEVAADRDVPGVPGVPPSAVSSDDTLIADIKKWVNERNWQLAKDLARSIKDDAKKARVMQRIKLLESTEQLADRMSLGAQP